MPTQVKRGDIYWLNWRPGRGSEQLGLRPALIVQTNVPNGMERYPLTIVVAITSALKGYRSSVLVQPSADNGLKAPSEVLCNQLQTVDKRRLGEYVGHISASDMRDVDERIRYMLDL